jgi:carbon-monoxide dehydrogenase medium subunit
MYAFTLERPATLADAARLAAAGAKPLAGGQTMLASMKLRLSSPEQVADLSGIKELTGICREGNAFVIGAMTRHIDVANNDPSACYPSAVLALGATIHTTSRKIAADDFFQGMFATALNEGELITAISFPIPKRAAYMKFKQPASRFAMVGVFVAQFDAGVRVAVTGAANGVFRHSGLEAALSASFTPAAAAAVKIDASELNSDIHATAAYRANLISVQTQRGVAKALG